MLPAPSSRVYFWAILWFGLVKAASSSEVGLQYKELYFSQKLDHFDTTSQERWQHRYLLSDAYWTGSGRLQNGCKGPILLYTGNEGPIEAFWEGSGFMKEVLAPELGGLLVFPEERYYGKSLPFGNESFVPENIKYLSTEQVIEDYVSLIAHLKATLSGAHNCPVVAFGGSYGGTLTTFLRVSHPEAVVGGLAASAPIGYYDRAGWEAHGVTKFTWSDIVTRDYDEAHPSCLSSIHRAVELINNANVSHLIEEFNVCEDAGLGSKTKSELFLYALESLPQLDYPYEVGGRPAWPVNYSCNLLVNADPTPEALIRAAADITRTALGTTDAKACMPTLAEGPGGVPGDGPGPGAWGWQSCTENLHQFSSRGIRAFNFSLRASAELPCRALFGGVAVLNTTRLTGLYGGYGLGDGKVNVSNLIWSNGGLDPWSGGGFLTPVAGSEARGIHYIFMPEGAHHLDLRGPHPDDPTSVTEAREKEKAIVKGWIREASQA